MNPRTWLNIALGVAVVALAGVAYFQPGQKKPEPDPTLTTVSPTEVAEVTIRPGKGQAVELERSEGRWRLTVPRELPADKPAAQSLVDLLQAKSRGTVEGADGQAAKYGLKDPDWVIEAAGHTLALGGKHPIERQRFLRVGDTVHRVDSGAVRTIKTDWTAYVSRQLVPRDGKLTDIELPEVTLSKTDEGEWKGNGKATMKPSEAKAAVRTWRNRRAMGVDAASPPSSGKPTVTLHFANRDPIRYVIQREKNRVRLISPQAGVSYSILAGQSQELLAPHKTGDSKDEKADGAGSSAGKGSARSGS